MVKPLEIPKIETLSTEYVAKALHTTPPKVIAMMLNGTLPIGPALRAGDIGERGNNRAIIIKSRWEAYIKALDLGASG